MSGASPLATPPIAVGKTTATGPASDVATSPRANAPPPDLRGNARAAARRAGEAARNGASVVDALAAAKAPPVPEPTPAEVAPSPAEEPETSGEAPEFAEPESPLDVKTRVRQREQRMQRELSEREQRLASREMEIQQREHMSRQVLERHARLENLRKTDVGKWAQEIGLDEATLKPIVMGRIAANKPEGQILTAQQRIDALEQRIAERDQQQQQQAQTAQRAQSEQAFVHLATEAAKYPTVAAIYADEPAELVREAWSIQTRFQQQFRRVPTQEEIAANLERTLKDRVQRASKALGAAPTPAATPPLPPKAKPPSPSEQTRTAPVQRSERVETDRERKERAAREAKKAIAASNKRNTPQAR